MKTGDDGSNSPSVSILERALTEVFPDGQQEQKSSQVQLYSLPHLSIKFRNGFPTKFLDPKRIQIRWLG